MILHDELLRLFPRLRDLPTHAYVVGGAVRDLTLGAAPADVDVACLDPLACARLFRRKIIRLGREEHLSAYRVVDGPHIYDFALLDNNIDADLARRDFTINAMAVDLESGELLDPHEGRADLTRRLVRMIDESNFDDDPLRMLKAVRMAVRFGFEIDGETLNAIRIRSTRIADVSVERVAYELTVIFSANTFRRAVTLLRETSLDLPLFGRSPDSDFNADDVPLAAALALLVGDAHVFAKRWRLSDALMREIQTLQRLIASHSLLDLYDAGEPIARQLPPMLRAVGRDDVVAFPDFAIKPLLTGDEIAAIAGIETGPRIGVLKRALLEAELEGRITNREDAERFVRTS
ncbi:MAG TPA: hypothetical protein VGQ65_01155 [Thermoanaerobaculia bacterium]|jgi:tRNA nucleotidyltransferase/poly(A) polymerase|nr:hypothetical protein [Thermoanaerobaculia bacterium]